jgi:uncharacterized protein YodC (DUF2158 family)
MELEMCLLTNPRMIVAALLLAACAPYSAIASPSPMSSQDPITSHPAPQLKQGDLVRLRSGGPMMTVSNVRGDQVNCLWTDLNGQPDDANFPAYVLQKF